MKYHVTKDFTILSEMHHMCYQVFEQSLRLSVTDQLPYNLFLFLYISLLTHPTFPYLQLHVWVDTCSWYDILALNFIEVKNLQLTLTLHIQSYVWLMALTPHLVSAFFHQFLLCPAYSFIQQVYKTYCIPRSSFELFSANIIQVLIC